MKRCVLPQLLVGIDLAVICRDYMIPVLYEFRITGL